MNHIQQYQPVAAITWNVQFPFNVYGEGETFGQVFAPYIDETYSDHEIETIFCDNYTDQSLTGVDAGLLYNPETCAKTVQSLNWRNELNGYWNKYFKITNETILDSFEMFKMFVEQERAEGKTIITFLARHLDHGKEQVNKVVPQFELYDTEIEKITGGDLSKALLICMTDSMEAFNYFSEKYKDANIRFPPVERQWAHELQTGYTSGTNGRISMAVLSVLYLSVGDYLLHPASNMATAAMYINTEIKNRYLIGQGT